MGYSRGEIVTVEFRLPPDGRFEEHPVIVLSNSEINDYEEGFIGVMMSTTNPDDEYSFEIRDDMVTVPFNDNRHREIRLHLIGNFINKDVRNGTHKRNLLKEDHFRRLIVLINEITFGMEVKL